MGGRLIHGIDLYTGKYGTPRLFYTFDMLPVYSWHPQPKHWFEIWLLILLEQLYETLKSEEEILNKF